MILAHIQAIIAALKEAIRLAEILKHVIESLGNDDDATAQIHAATAALADSAQHQQSVLSTVEHGE